ncbi:MAG TPA: fructosamine kinase family protein [Acidimicrobiales bacterium]
MGGALASHVAAALGRRVARTAPVAGGSISDAHRADLVGGGTVLAKAAAGLPPGLLEVEAEGLAWLAEVPGVRVPAVLARTPDVLVLEWVEPGPPTAGTDADLGHHLALLHGAAAPAFGWHRDGFIGREPQRNTPVRADWCGFWIEYRIAPLAVRAIDRGALAPRASDLVDRLAARLPGLAGPPAAPVRVHGDLWSGNVHVDRDGLTWLVDPAPYAGHPEVDLAMLHLFGAPGPGTAAVYEEVRPLAPGWRERLPIWQLEPLLVHAAMFGGGYGARALAVLERFA